MKFENTKSDGMSREYKVVLFADEIESGVVAAIAERAKTFKMPGYRAGHVPLNLVRGNLESVVIKDVVEDLIHKACVAVIDDSQAEQGGPSPQCRIENSYRQGDDLEVIVTVEISPVFELKPYDFTIVKVIPKVTDEDTDELIASLMEMAPIREPADESHEIRALDEVSYRAVLKNADGSVVRKRRESVVIPQEPEEGAEFLQAFMGKRIGSSFELRIDDKQTIEVTIKKVNKAITDLAPTDYVQRVSTGGINELSGLLQTSLKTVLDSEVFDYHRSQILKEICKQYDFDVPKGIFEQEMQNFITEINANQEDSPNSQKKTEKELREECAPIVRDKIRLGYIFDKIAKEQNITVSPEEVGQMIMAEANFRPPHEREALLNYYRSTPDAVTHKASVILERKVVQFLISKAKIKEEIEKTKSEIADLLDGTEENAEEPA
jgi:trigger factor